MIPLTEHAFQQAAHYLTEAPGRHAVIYTLGGFTFRATQIIRTAHETDGQLGSTLVAYNKLEPASERMSIRYDAIVAIELRNT